MAITKMKRLRLIAMNQDRDGLLKSLLHAGCVEISEPEAYLEDEEWSALLKRGSGDLSEAKALQTELKQAVDVLAKYAPQKSGMFAARDEIRERDLMDRKTLDKTLETARKVNGHAKSMGQLAARVTRLQADQMALRPWESCSLPLEQKGTRTVRILLGAAPNTVDFHAMTGAVTEAAECVEITKLSEDREQQYLEVLVHKDQEQSALEALRSCGFTFSQLKELTGTASENIKRLDEEIRQTQRQMDQELEGVKSLASARKELEVCIDRVEQDLSTEGVKERLLTDGSILYLDGWLPAEDAGKLEKALKGFDCAWELTEPDPEDYPNVPIKLKNNKLTRCMNTVTEMYSLPAYDGVDPNPLMAPFFIVFFGVMLADMGYGLLMMLGTQFMLRKTKPKNPNFMELFFWCGVSTFIVGALTGGFFGDFIPQLLKIINPASTFEMPALFTPLNDTMPIMIGSLVMGVIQIFTGMTVSVVKKCQEGQFIDALFSEITWWIILAGVALAIFGIGTVAGVPVVLVIGILMLVFGGTRNAKGFGKVTCLVGLVYNGVTGYFSDTLSYIRIMALMLSGSVIASVFNTLGATFGNVILFVIISMVGNALNLALNLLGCYVHDLRLQCLEFFGRFYKEGGKPYQPLAINTKYVDVIKEEN
ncbi:MAG: V-type ATP synthase subunit I [Oscillospiraceae bacterium]|jgi:V/A-type H+-transporting ATPase subunit I|nr:V-type ATP synthase subunit I [Oscillospiraceae bacterium]